MANLQYIVHFSVLFVTLLLLATSKGFGRFFVHIIFDKLPFSHFQVLILRALISLISFDNDAYCAILVGISVIF